MKKIIPVIVWIIFLIGEITIKASLNEIIYVQTEITLVIILVIGYKRGVKKYRNIPIKTVNAKFIKDYKSYDTSNPDVDRDLYIGIYEYKLNGKKHKVKLSSLYSNDWTDTITLFYRKGACDIHTEECDDIPLYYRLLWTFLICPGSGIIVALILNYILKIPIR